MEKGELAELLLAFLCECVEEAGHSYFFFNINRFASQIGVRDFAELMGALERLEEEGFVVPATGPFGEASAMITDAGLVFVEGGGTTGIIDRYRNDPASFGVPDAATAGNAPPGHEKLVIGAQIYDLLTRIVDIVKGDTSLSRGEVDDFARDVEALNLQLGRQARNEALINSLLAGMAQIQTIRTEVTELKELIDAYLK
jgi:hypothetical protein